MRRCEIRNIFCKNPLATIKLALISNRENATSKPYVFLHFIWRIKDNYAWHRNWSFLSRGSGDAVAWCPWGCFRRPFASRHVGIAICAINRVSWRGNNWPVGHGVTWRLLVVGGDACCERIWRVVWVDNGRVRVCLRPSLVVSRDRRGRYSKTTSTSIE